MHPSTVASAPEPTTETLMQHCLEPAELQGLFTPTTVGQARRLAAIVGHLDGCGTCRQDLCALRASPKPVEPPIRESHGLSLVSPFAPVLDALRSLTSPPPRELLVFSHRLALDGALGTPMGFTRLVLEELRNLARLLPVDGPNGCVALYGSWIDLLEPMIRSNPASVPTAVRANRRAQLWVDHAEVLRRAGNPEALDALQWAQVVLGPHEPEPLLRADMQLIRARLADHGDHDTLASELYRGALATLEVEGFQPRRAEILWELARRHRHLGQAHTARDVCAEAWQLLEPVDDPYPILAIALALLGATAALDLLEEDFDTDAPDVEKDVHAQWARDSLAMAAHHVGPWASTHQEDHWHLLEERLEGFERRLKG